VFISRHTHRQTRICAHSALSNSQMCMCISVIETKRSPIHGLVPLHSDYDKIPPGLLENHIAPNPLDGGLNSVYTIRYLRQEALLRSWVIRKNLGGTQTKVVRFRTFKRTAPAASFACCRFRSNFVGFASVRPRPGATKPAKLRPADVAESRDRK
jgi:hypothetical protein